FSSSPSAPPLLLPSFPTRRSSDLRGLVPRDEPGDDLGRRSLHLSGVDLSRRSVDRQPVAFLECPAVGLHDPRLVVDLDRRRAARSEEHTSELQSLRQLVCRLLLEK